MAIHAVVMAGGSGTRFWPLSRMARPKQLLALGPSEHSLLRCTVDRVAELVPPERVWVVTTRRIADQVAEDLPHVPRANILAEPEGRNTAPCIGWAAVRALHADPDATLVVLPADHHIEDEAEFRAVLRRGIEASADGALVTCGITPTRPDTGYGYLEVGESLGGTARRCVRFVEKPNAERAAEFLSSGNFLWNSGLFVFRADAIVAAIRAHLPELSSELDGVASALGQSGDDADVIGARYAKMPSISIDHGVMERADRVVVVPGSFGWSDLGSYETAWELAPKDDAQNALRGDVFTSDARGNFVRAPEGKFVALVGVDDLVVVDTGDALLVMPRSRSQDVRRIVDALAARGDARR